MFFRLVIKMIDVFFKSVTRVYSEKEYACVTDGKNTSIIFFSFGKTEEFRV